MMKKFTIIVLLMVLLKATLFSQNATVSLSSVTPSPGQHFTVPLTVTNFTNISSMTFIIKFDPTAITPEINSQGKLNLTSFATGFDLTNFIGYVQGGNKLVITFSEQTMPPIADGTLFNLNFASYCGTSGTSLEFQTGSEVGTGINPTTVLPVVFNNGQINNVNANATVGIENMIFNFDMANPSVTVPISVSNFTSNVGSIDLHIQYDPSKLAYIKTTGVGVLTTGLVANANNGIISIAWTKNSGGALLNDGTILNLKFAYTGTDIGNLNFYPCCLIGNATGNGYFDVKYTNGSVSPDFSGAIPNVKLDSITDAIQGQVYEVPLTFSGFHTTSPDAIGAYTLHVTYDNPKLSFIDVSSNTSSALVNAVGNVINIVWTKTTASDINGQALKLKFRYNGVGAANINLSSGCSFSNMQSALVNVAYSNAAIIPASITGNATIENVSGSVGNNVLIPIDFSDLPNNMGAVTLNIDYDNTKLTYIDAPYNNHGATVILNPSTHKIQIAWSSINETDLNGIFLKLRFAYNFAGNGTGAVVSFADGCELTTNTATIIPANWNNGGLNLKSKISGILSYDSDPNPRQPLFGFKVYLKNLSGDTLDSYITNANGYYEFKALNGQYVITASSPDTAIWYADFDDATTITNYISSLMQSDIPYFNLLKLKAADVNQSGDIDYDDVTALLDRISNPYSSLFTAPDFLFETPHVDVYSADMPNIDFLGICSGNVNGYSNPNP